MVKEVASKTSGVAGDVTVTVIVPAPSFVREGMKFLAVKASGSGDRSKAMLEGKGNFGYSAVTGEYGDMDM